ncbi:MAG: hypothetical protein OSB41_11110 [Kiritimatiellae bacterium]|nr:hypothetical protein [Kiritimatiellia bacterium]
MHITIAGQDRNETLAKTIEQTSDRRANRASINGRIAEQADVLALKTATTTSAYLTMFSTLASSKSYVQTSTFARPAATGKLGRMTDALRQILWKLCRWQADVNAYKQNAINQQLAHLTMMEREERNRQITELRRRIDTLESRDKNR